MNVTVNDNQLVGETEAQILEILQQSPVDAHMFMTNRGTNTINFRFQKLATDGTWTNLGAQGSAFYNTLMAGQVKSVVLSDTSPRIRLLGNASGGSSFEFQLSRYHARTAGAAIPLLSL